MHRNFYTIVLFFLFATPALFSQNVGVGTTTPTEKLDVNGNINVSGTIKVNGTDGAANQVLMKNSNGDLSWGDMCQFKNFASFISNGSWTVPAGVTKIYVEVWGGGGGGNQFAGGGGGGYIRSIFTVLPADEVTITVGAGGTGAGAATAINGSTSSAIVNGVSILGSGGNGAAYNSATSGTAGSGGGYSNSASAVFMAFFGKNGESIEKTFSQYDATTWYETGKAGRGGDAGNTHDMGGYGGYYIYNTTTATLVHRTSVSAAGRRPGGGGAGGLQFGGTVIQGGSGSSGLVNIYY